MCTDDLSYMSCGDDADYRSKTHDVIPKKFGGAISAASHDCSFFTDGSVWCFKAYFTEQPFHHPSVRKVLPSKAPEDGWGSRVPPSGQEQIADCINRRGSEWSAKWLGISPPWGACAATQDALAKAAALYHPRWSDKPFRSLWTHATLIRRHFRRRLRRGGTIGWHQRRTWVTHWRFGASAPKKRVSAPPGHCQRGGILPCLAHLPMV